MSRDYPFRSLAIAVLTSGLTACATTTTQPLVTAAGQPQTGGAPGSQPAAELSAAPAAKAESESRKLPVGESGNAVAYTVAGESNRVVLAGGDFTQVGMASWYGREFQGELTASGEVFDMHKLTAAHKSLPLPSYVRVTNLQNGRDVIVRVNDRGPFHGNRIIDVSYAAAKRLGMLAEGTVKVRIETVTVISPNTSDSSNLSLYLQAGTFAKPGEARDLARQLQSMGLERVLITPTRQGELRYRVRVGPFESPGKLSSARALLTRAGFEVHALRT